ncbi:MAG: hypothetical protein PHD76_14725, partial [Methylacidiphilales bacterium]|nr:hypothetical protein [Candidatus Methylacidiphilales bacterium]
MPAHRSPVTALAVLLFATQATAQASSGPVSFTADNQTISGLTIIVPNGSSTPAVTLAGHKGCKLLNCLIKHQLGTGVSITGGSDDYTIDTCNIICTAAPAVGPNPNSGMNNIYVNASARGKINNVRLENGSTGIYMVQCSQGPTITQIEGHNMRGPFPRGQLMQADNSPNGSLSNFSIVNDRNIAWTEDCINIYECSGWSISQGLIDGNNSPSGDNIIFEGYPGALTTSGTVDHVDSIHFGNGAFGCAGAQNIVFTNCRADYVSLASWQGRGTPLSNGLIFGAINNGTNHSSNITYASTCLWGPNAGTNIAYEVAEMNFSATGPTAFTPRAPLSLTVPTDGGSATLTHQYTFNAGNFNDSVGTANGTLNGSASISGGALQLSGGSNGTAYGSLPTSVMSGLTSASFEGWFTESAIANWEKVFFPGNTDTSSFLGMSTSEGTNGRGRSDFLGAGGGQFATADVAVTP